MNILVPATECAASSPAGNWETWVSSHMRWVKEDVDNVGTEITEKELSCRHKGFFIGAKCANYYEIKLCLF